MTWTFISDDHFDREEIFTLPRSAALLDLEAKVWSNRQLKDGRIPAVILARITTSSDVEADVQALVDAGVWTVIDGFGWQVQWDDQQDAAEVLSRREADKAKQRRARERAKKHATGDHSLCDARFCTARRHPVTSPGDSPGDSPRELPPPSLSSPIPSPPSSNEEWEVDRTRGGSDGPGAGAPVRRPPAKKNWRKTGDGKYIVDMS